MTTQHQSITPEQRAKLAQVLEIAERAEQKARRMAELAAEFQKKYQR